MNEYKETHHSLMYNSISDLSLYSAGYDKCYPEYSYGPKFRSYQLIHFVLSGKGELHIDKHIFNLSAGDAFIIPSGKVSYYKASKDSPWSYAWISFIGINSEMYIYQLMSSLKDVYIINGLDIEKYKNSIFEIIALKGNTTSNYLKSNSILLDILSMLFNDVKFNENNWGRTSVADEVKFFLDTNYSEKLKIQDIAKSFGIHPNYLTRVFHEKFNISPKQYLIDLKLKKACKLLSTTDLPISIIADSLGFDDQLAFSKIFKKSFYISPSRYRLNNELNEND